MYGFQYLHGYWLWLDPLHIGPTLVARTFPGTDSEVPSKEHAEDSGYFLADVEPEPFPHHNMPGGPDPGVKRILDHLSCLEIS